MQETYLLGFFLGVLRQNPELLLPYLACRIQLGFFQLRQGINDQILGDAFLTEFVGNALGTEAAAFGVDK